MSATYARARVYRGNRRFGPAARRRLSTVAGWALLAAGTVGGLWIASAVLHV